VLPSCASLSAENTIVPPANPSIRQSAALESVNDPVVTGGERALAILTVAGLVIVPTIFLTGVYDYFRVIKEVAFRAEAILAVFLLGVAVAAGGTARLRELVRARAVMAVVAAAFLWSVITAMLSTNKFQSAESMITAVCSIALFIGVWFASRSVPVAALLILAPAAAVNAVITALLEYDIWRPFEFTLVSRELASHQSTTGLIGNPNDVGAYLALCAVVLLGAAQHLRGWKRWIAALGGLVALAGVFASQTRTAVITAGVALFILAVRKSLFAGLAMLGVLLAGLIAASFTPIPVLTRLLQVPQQVARGQWGAMTSHRNIAFVAAIDMARERPLTGWGPGTYKAHYMHRRLESLANHPEQTQSETAAMFGETHNDHLQLLAECGVPAYALFLAALVLIARARADGGGPARAAAILGAPFAAAIFVLALAFFPLQIAVTRHLMLTMAALLIGWRSA
jgi:O-antigen ligase